MANEAVFLGIAFENDGGDRGKIQGPRLNSDYRFTAAITDKDNCMSVCLVYGALL